MNHDCVQFLWLDRAAARGVRTGVSLHGHTLYSKECLNFLPRSLGGIPGASLLLRLHASQVEFARAYWTPPLTPASAVDVEERQIAELGLTPLVSLTDHDTIEAGLSLQVARRREEVPVSVEWTVPFAGSIFHLGVHNLPAKLDRAWMAAMAEHTASPEEALLGPLLRALSATPGALLVLNHPFWLEEGVTAATHAAALRRFLPAYANCVHAFELNGTRPWKENRDTLALADEFRRPVISGGDRHACEPAACINLTRASTFAEFAAEVRDGRSEVLFLPQYREPLASRVLEAARDILRTYPEYPGRERWTDRVFYCCDDGVERPLSELWRDGMPWLARAGAVFAELATKRSTVSALRLVLANRAGIAQ